MRFKIERYKKSTNMKDGPDVTRLVFAKDAFAALAKAGCNPDGINSYDIGKGKVGAVYYGRKWDSYAEPM